MVLSFPPVAVGAKDKNRAFVTRYADPRSLKWAQKGKGIELADHALKSVMLAVFVSLAFNAFQAVEYF